MKRIIAKWVLRDFWKQYPDSEQYLKTWYDTTKNSKWNSPNEVKQTFIKASVLKNGRIVFNINEIHTGLS